MNDKKTITVLNVMEDGRIAGPQLRMLRVGVALLESVNTIIAIPIRGPHDFKELLDDTQLQYVQVPLSKLSRKPTEILRSVVSLPSEVFSLKKAIVCNQADIVHSSGGAWMFKAIVAAKLAGVPSVWHLNDTCSPTVFRLLARWLIKRSVNGVIVAGARVQSHYLADFDAHYADKVQLKVIEAPVDTGKFLPHINKPANDIFQIATVGNISPVKGYETLIKAASALGQLRDFKWSVIGHSLESQMSYRRVLDGLVERLGLGKSQMGFMGPSAKVQVDLAKSDVYVCTSVSEASPTSVWEAMSCGLPVVATDVGSVAEHIEHGVNGFIVKVGDYKKMAEFLNILAQDADLRVQMGKINREIAVERFDLEVCARKHHEIYTNLLARQDKNHD